MSVKIDNSTPYELLKSGLLIKKVSDGPIFSNFSHKTITIPTSGNFSPRLLGSTPGNDIFSIKKDSCSRIEKAFIYVKTTDTYTDPSATDTRLVPCCFWLTQITISVNGETSTIQVIDDLTNYLNYTLLSDGELEAYTKYNHLSMNSKTYQSEFYIKPQGQNEFYIPLSESIINSINAMTIKAPINITLMWRNDYSSLVIQGSGILRMDELHLRLVTEAESVKTQDEIRSLFETNKYFSFYTGYKHISFPIPLQSGSINDLTLTGFNVNRAIFMALMIRNGQSGDNYSKGFYLGSEETEIGGKIDLLDKNKNSITGEQSSGYCRSINGFGLEFPGKMSKNNPIYFLNFSDNPKKAIIDGVDTGGLRFEGTEILRLTIPTYVAATSASCVFTPSINATAGKYRINVLWNDGTRSSTNEIAFDANQAAVNVALTYFYPPLRQKMAITAGAGNLNAGALTLTVANPCSDYVNGGIVQLEKTNLAGAAGASVFIAPTIPTGGVVQKGILTGTYTVEIVIWMMEQMTQVKGRVMNY